MAILQKTNKKSGKDEEKKMNPYTLLVEMYISAASKEISTEVPQKTKNSTI
jgi:hypothetical protein